MKLFVLISIVCVIILAHNIIFGCGSVDEEPKEIIDSEILRQAKEIKWTGGNNSQPENNSGKNKRRQFGGGFLDQPENRKPMEMLLQTFLTYGKCFLDDVADEQAIVKFLLEFFPSIKIHTGKLFQRRGSERSNPANNTLQKWILSLVRVEGDTISNFLRIYRVQILWDLAFSIFKWLFYAWLGWFIP